MNKVSIIVPCYNQAQYLNEALDSVYNQTYQDWECVIVNDGSPDDTEEVAKAWLEMDVRFKYIYKANGGLSSARNAGIAIAQGEFILPLDADDKISQDYIKLAIKAFQEDDSLKVVYSKVKKFGCEIGLWQLPVFSLYNLTKNNMIFCSAFFKKRDWELVGGYDINMVYGWEDWEFWIAILKNGGNVKQLDNVGFYYRIKEKSMLKELNFEKKKYLLEYMSIKHTAFFIGQLGSFNHLNGELENLKNEYECKLKSEKFVIDLFFKTFFGTSFFGTQKKTI